MKPTFALDLTRDVIALLHRTPKGWLSIGEVAFDAPDLDEAVAYLRKTALGLSPMGMACKIVLPASQILYTEIHAPGPSRDEKRRQIAAALEGRTPYAVEDLVFDWSGKGATVKVAVVARETLDEAEAFAVGHRLNPVSTVAIPEAGAFVGEPWFGPTAAAAQILIEGETVDRDRDPVVILDRQLPHSEPTEPDEPLPGLEEALNGDLPELVPDPRGATEIAPEGDGEALPPEVLPGLDEALNGDLPAAETATFTADGPGDVQSPFPDTLPGLDEALNGDLPEGAMTPAPQPEVEPLTPELEVHGDDLPGGSAPNLLDEIPALDLAVERPANPAVEMSEHVGALADADLPLTGMAGPDTNLPPDEPSNTLTAEVEEAPFAEVPDNADNDTQDLPRTRQLVLDDIPDDDLPPAPSAAAMVAFSSRRNAAIAGAAPPVVGATRAESAVIPSGAGTGGPAAPVGAAGDAIARPALSKGAIGSVTAPSIAGLRSKPRLKPGADVARPGGQTATTVKSPARPGGTFGNTPAPRKRTGLVFLTLVALLLVGLALVAAWASFVLVQGEARLTDEPAVELTLAPDVDDEMLADLQDPAEIADSGAWADGIAPATNAAADVGDLASSDLPVNIGGEDAAAVETLADAAAEAAAPRTAGEPAPATTLTTELSAAQPPLEDQDEIFLSAMDAPPPALDALALPDPSATIDIPPAAPLPPPAPGTVYRFGADGLLVPTPDGILSPDGVMLIAGKPPVIPPSRSAAAAALAAEAAAVAAPLIADVAPTAADASLVTADETVVEEPVGADPALAGFRPRPRPEGLTPASDDDARLMPESGTEVVSVRPLPRPDTVVTAAAATRPAGESADLGAQGASLAAQAEAQLAAAAALEAENPSIVAISMRPAARPRDLSRAVEAAVAAAVREPEPEVIAVAAAAPAPEIKPEELDEMEEPEVASAAPSIPTKASVAKQATYTKAINLKKLNLIGTYGTDSRRYALIRLSNGSYKKVKVGDKIDGGTVKAITETEVRYQKGGKLLTLKMPKV